MEHSIWDVNQPHTGNHSVYGDFGADAWMGQCFYWFNVGAITAEAAIVAVRVWTPVGSPSQVSVRVWSPISDNADITSNNHDAELTGQPVNAGGWTEVRLESPIPVPATQGGLMSVAYQFTNSKRSYVHSPSGRGSGSALQAYDGSNLYWSEPGQTPPYTWFYEAGGSVASGGAATVSYGLDLVVEDTPGEVEPPDTEPGVYYSNGLTWTKLAEITRS